MLDIAYNISQDPFQTKHRPLTPNTNETVIFFSHPYLFTPHTQYSIYLNPSKITNEDEMDAEKQNIFILLTDKWYI